VLISTIEGFHRCFGISATIGGSCLMHNGFAGAIQAQQLTFLDVDLAQALAQSSTEIL
jgi:hypothetical protein